MHYDCSPQKYPEKQKRQKVSHLWIWVWDFYRGVWLHLPTLIFPIHHTYLCIPCYKKIVGRGLSLNARTGIRTRVGGSAGLQDIQATSCGLFDDINHCYLFQNKITIFIFAYRLYLLIAVTHGSQLLPARFQNIIIYPEAKFINNFQCLIF